MPILSEIDGKTELTVGSQGRTIKVSNKIQKEFEYKLPTKSKSKIKSGDWVEVGDILSTDDSIVSEDETCPPDHLMPEWRHKHV